MLAWPRRLTLHAHPRIFAMPMSIVVRQPRIAIALLVLVSWATCAPLQAGSPPYLILRHGVAPTTIPNTAVAGERGGIAGGAGSIVQSEPTEPPQELPEPTNPGAQSPENAVFDGPTPYGAARFRALPYLAGPRHATDQHFVPRDPGPPRGYEVYAEPYAYGWFGASPRVHRSRSYGYYGNYIQWSFR
jgi:hypothetical protein